MQNLLATYPDIQGVWVQDGMAAGAWRSIMAADKAKRNCLRPVKSARTSW